MTIFDGAGDTLQGGVVLAVIAQQAGQFGDGIGRVVKLLQYRNCPWSVATMLMKLGDAYLITLIFGTQGRGSGGCL
jgi:hypothetical protein